MSHAAEPITHFLRQRSSDLTKIVWSLLIELGRIGTIYFSNII